ncbi:aldehyde ferredoxin oxidoreductase family protein [Desulfotomaculum nigrificans]|uniref:aldehyde ferredoxin oxidoreductase family protein n=1 Tax=Desulfotomaculum nigrificans TaxID=1565 RepID=UPI0001FAE70D|nr:aldehyde ferredoxin oxidoreductase family protein [Desulfotomaculum nigrificans]
MKGYAGKLLRVNLTTGAIGSVELKPEVARKYLGGRGLAARILFDEVPAGADPLGPENKVVIGAGPLANSKIPGSTRYIVCTKSPLTGGWGDAHAAGALGPMIKKAGFDAIIIEGSSPKPVYIYVNNGSAEIRDASHLWSMETGACRDQIITETNPGAEVAAIGIAGENLVPYACVISEYNRAAGRSGTGAVLGAKKVKAVAFYGEAQLEMADPEKVDRIRKQMILDINNSPACQGFRTNGTANGVAPHNALGMYPAYNFKEGVSDNIDLVSGETMTRTILAKREACPNCPVFCRRIVKVDSGPYASDSRYGGPEFETIGSLGTCVGIYDLAAITKANELCNKFGVDTINVGLSIAWAMECYEKGILTKEDTGGLDLTWGNVDTVLYLIEAIAKRQGLGELLGKGLKVASEIVGKGSDAFAMQVKNQAFPVHMPRGKIGQGLSFATSNRGACHCQGTHDTNMEAGKIMPDIGFDEKFKGLSRLTKEHKAELEKLAQDMRGWQDSLIACRFVSWDYGPTTPATFAELLNALTGWDVTPKELMEIGERIFNLCRMFNVREGMNRKDDTLPARCGESLPRGATAGSVITKEDLNRLLDEYYELRGWDNNGIPTPEKLRSLGL